ncbi:HAD hydrolase family protein [bacterium]|nr:HAD hydrolase family protein [bacterium]MCI0601652.1 HAD hydrolase family protein [bacterium]
MNNPLVEKARKIKMLLLDVDGVMTSGQVLLTPQGEELKHFSIHDGFGMVCAMKAGIRIGIISGRSSPSLRMRCDELKIEDLYMDTMDKLPVLAEIMRKYGLSPEEIAYAGDDLPDLPVLLRVGLSVAPQNAHHHVKSRVDLQLSKAGGEGAVRELTDFLLAAQGKEEKILEQFL